MLRSKSLCAQANQEGISPVFHNGPGQTYWILDVWNSANRPNPQRRTFRQRGINLDRAILSQRGTNTGVKSPPQATCAGSV